MTLAHLLQGSSSKDSSHVAPQSLESSVVPVGVPALLLAVLPTSVHSLLPEFDTLDKTVSAFLCDSWSTLRESVGPITRQDDEEYDAMRTSLPTLESCTVAAGRDFPSLTPADVRVALRGLMSWQRRGCTVCPRHAGIGRLLWRI